MSNHQSNLKPMNIFFIWYGELCRRSNTSPLASVKPPKPKNDTVLDFTADRIKPEEWTSIINALRLDTSLHIITIRSRLVGCKFLYDMNTEDKVRHMKRRTASLWTDYIMKSLVRSLSNCIKNTQVLSILELDGLPLSGEYFELLLQALRNNKTIKVLSFKHCPIHDVGCQQLCSNLRYMPNVEVLNLSSCSLSSVSGQYIARVIKHQQINRYCESWHNSLRYEDPTAGVMAGLKRITLNNNPNIGDDGLSSILNELDDDLWIKALDMQKCSITEQISSRLIDVVEYSRSLEIADFRNNDRLSFATIEKILEVLQKKHQFGNDSEYHWCVTSTTLYDFGSYEPSSSNMSGMTAVIQKSKSAPLRQVDLESRSSAAKPALRRTKTLTMIDRKTRHNAICNSNAPNKRELENAKKQLVELNAKLQLEISKRKQTEKINVELKQTLEDIKKLGSLHSSGQNGLQDKFSTMMRILENLGSKDDDLAFPGIKESLHKKSIKEKLSKTKTISKPKVAKKVPCDRPKSPKKVLQPKSAPKRVFSPAVKISKDEKIKAQSMFEKYLYKDKRNQDVVDENNEQVDNVLNYFYDSDVEDTISSSVQNTQGLNVNGNASPMSASNVSLEKFLQEISEDNRSSSGTSSVLPGSSQQHDKNHFRKLMLEVT